MSFSTNHIDYINLIFILNFLRLYLLIAYTKFGLKLNSNWETYLELWQISCIKKDNLLKLNTKDTMFQVFFLTADFKHYDINFNFSKILSN